MAPHNVRWGMMATGGIVDKFTRDILIDPTLRKSNDITHTVAAIASSTSKARAEEFIHSLHLPNPCTAYGSYEELVQDPNVDIVYVATPHSHHFQNVMLALEHGKNVLCEKALTVNAAQARILVATARQKKLFLMEAVWTRYFPICVQMREMIRDGVIGEVQRVIADTSTGKDAAYEWDETKRMINMDLAGGALLDLGVYSLTWVFQMLYHTLAPSDRKPPSKISAQLDKHPVTGADQTTSIFLEFPQSTPKGTYKCHGVALSSLSISVNPDENWTAGPAIRIQGTHGEIQVYGDAYHPDKFKVIPRKVEGYQHADPSVREVVCEFPGEGRGMYWEADEAARCLRDGKLESETMPWEESLVIMDVMDEVRRQGELKYPEKIESTTYPLQL